MAQQKVVPRSAWVKKQQSIIDTNRALLEGDAELLKYPKLYSKLKMSKCNRGAKKYLLVLLDLFQRALDVKGLSYVGGAKPLIVSVSDRYIKELLHISNLKTVQNNINNLASYGLIKKLTDSELAIIDSYVYDSVIKLKEDTGINGNTITAYALLEWTEEVLSNANSIIIEDKLCGKTNKANSAITMNLLDHTGVITKTDKLQFSDDDKTNLDKLYDWAYQKCYKKGRAGFFTLDEYKAQFGPNRINVGQRKQAQYRVAICIKLNLIETKATKSNMIHIGTKPALALKCHQKTIFMPRSQN